MANVTRDFIVEKLKSYFPSLDTSEGSKVDSVIIKPLLEIGKSYDLSEFEDFLKTRIKELNPDAITTEGSANYDLIISTLANILEPLVWEIEALKRSQSLGAYKSLPTEEMDALVANYFVQRIQGSKARGTVRVYFSEPVTVFFGAGVKFSTKSGLRFIPNPTTMIQSDTMALSMEGGYYYCDVVVEAEYMGSEYNIKDNQIISIQNLTSPYASVKNSAYFTGGSDEESNEGLYSRTKDSLTVRNLVTAKSIRYNIQTEFPRVTGIEVIGAGNPEMTRDVIPYGVTTTTTITKMMSGGSPITISTETVTGANYVHTLGKSDIYLYTADLVDRYIDITNLPTNPSLRMGKNSPYSIDTPITRIKDVERLDPMYLRSTGQYIPYAHPIDCRALSDFYFSRDDNRIEHGVGTVRLYFERATNVSFSDSSTFTTDEGLVFRPVYTQSIAASGMELNTGQHITNTEMDTNIISTQDIKYYYMDVSVISDRVGDNRALLPRNTYLLPENYSSDGWSLSTQDIDLAFSVREEVVLSISSTFNDGIPIESESVRVSYEYAPTVFDIQEYIESNPVRVVTTDLLAKHFQPAYVDLGLSYEGPIPESDIKKYIISFINSIDQGAYLEISDLINYLYSYGVTRVLTPIEMLVLVLQKNRVYRAVRFQDRYRTPTRTHFIARNIDVRRLK